MSSVVTHLRFVYIAERLDAPAVLPQVFDGQGFTAELRTVSDPADVAATLELGCWDLVLVEWPVKGLELLAQIKKARSHFPALAFVALTEGQADEVVRAAAREAIAGEVIAWSELPERLTDLVPSGLQEGLDHEAAHALLQQRGKELIALHGVTSAAYAASSEDDLFERVTSIIADTLYPNQFGILLLDPVSRTLGFHPSYRGISEQYQSMRIELGKGVTGTVAKTGLAMNVPDVSRSEAYIRCENGVSSEICTPIRLGDEIIGVINAESNRPFAFSAEDERLLATLAFQLGVAVGRLRNDEALRSRAIQLTAIHDASEEIASTALEVKAVCQSVFRAVSRLIRFEAFNLTRWDRHNHEIEALILWDQGQFSPPLRIRDDQGWSSYVLESGASLKINDASQENSITPQPVHYGSRRQSRAVLVVPLKLAGRIVGTISVQSYQPGVFTWDDLRMLELIAGPAAIALENSRLYEEVSRQALTFANMFDAVIIADAETRIIDWNPAAEKLFGYRREEVLHKIVTMIYPSEVAEGLQPKIVTALAAEGRFAGEVTFARKDGTQGTADLVVVAVNNPDGQLIASIGVLRDITQRKIAEEALRISEARLAGIINSAMDGIVTVDEAGLIFMYNRAAAQMFGYESGEIIGRPIEVLMPDELWDLHRGLVEDYRRGDGAARKMTGRPFVRARRANGEEFSVEVSMSLLSITGHVYLTAIIRDISERVSAQIEMSRLAGGVHQAAETIILTDMDGNITYINPYGEKVTGYSADEVIGRNPRIFKSGLQDANFYRRLWDTLLSGRPWNGVLANRKKDGSLIYENSTIFPVKDETGAVVGYAAVKRDITDEIQREREMEAIVSVSTALRKAVSRKEMLPIVLEQLIAILDGKDAAIAFYEPQADRVYIELAAGNSTRFTGLRMPMGKGISGYVFQVGQPMKTDDISTEPGFQAVVEMDDLRAVVGTPLIAQGELIGVLWVGRPEPFSNGEFRVFQAVADMSANAIHRASLHERTSRYAEQTVAITAAGRAMAETLNLSQIFERLSISVNELVPGIRLLAILRPEMEAQACELIYAQCDGKEIDVGGKSFVPLGEMENSPLIRAIRSHEPVLLGSMDSADLDLTVLDRHPEEHRSAVIVPLVARGKVLSLLILVSPQENRFNDEEAGLLALMGSTAATAMENADLYQGLQNSNWELLEAYEQTLEGWSKALDLRDRETENHTQRVVNMTIQLGRELGLSDERLVHIRRGAMLHDIGKLGVQDKILLKNGPLTEEEWDEMRRHPGHAYDMLAPIGYLRSALTIPFCHHEKWDGSGYPRGLKGEEIPLEARIFAIIDVYDALTNPRPYRPAWPRSQAVQYIRDQASKHFDPDLVQVFLRLIDKPYV